jgi:beta-aspartyl-peptidase (threonine type)
VPRMPHRTGSSPNTGEGSALLVAHGGAGTWPAPQLVAALAGLSAAAEAGWAGLAEQGPLVSAVTAVRVLEDDTVFNAGHGAVLTADGDVELDASVMEGATRRVGAVGAVRGVPNPVEAAKAVLDDGRHCLVAGAGAAELARAHGLPVDAQASLRRAARPAAEPTVRPAAQPAARPAAGPYARQPASADPAGSPPTRGGDTVGAICRDEHGRLAVAVSTGGVAGKLPGRIGDSAICGAGFYADDRIGAACCTGIGEAFLRLVLAKRAVDLLAVGMDAPGAAGQAVAELTAAGYGEGGLLVVARGGPPGLAGNAPNLPWVLRTATGEQTGIVPR